MSWMKTCRCITTPCSVRRRGSFEPGTRGDPEPFLVHHAAQFHVYDVGKFLTAAEPRFIIAGGERPAALRWRQMTAPRRSCVISGTAPAADSAAPASLADPYSPS